MNYATKQIHPTDRDKMNASHVSRPPIISIMGHVDHGKTTLLDHLRNSRIAQSEAGGITQRLGAFTLRDIHINKSSLVNNEVNNSIVMTILDTPGHEAFTTIRSRASHSADIVILVIAIEDGIMPQTEECIRLIEGSKTSLIIAINKIDKLIRDEGEVNNLQSKSWRVIHEKVRRIEENLTKYNLMTESFGGSIQTVPISALKGINVPLLLQSIVAQAEMMELKDLGMFEGSVLEASQRMGMGHIATVLVKSGELKVGDFLVALDEESSVMGKVRSIIDVDGNHVQRIGASEPGLVSGWQDTPTAGAQLFQTDTMEEACQIVEENKRIQMLSNMKVAEKMAQRLAQQNMKIIEERREQRKGSMSSMISNQYDVSQVSTKPELRIVLICDTIGSMDAVERCINGIPQSKAMLTITSKHLGNITITDIDHASITNSVIVTFPIDIPKNLKKYAEHKKVKFMNHKVIYHLIEEIKNELTTKLPPIITEEVTAKAKVLQIFTQSDGSKIYGLHITQGTFTSKKDHNNLIYVMRNGQILGQVEITSMRQEKRVVQEVNHDMQCGVMLKKVIGKEKGSDEEVEQEQEVIWDIKEGDELKLCKCVSKAATL